MSALGFFDVLFFSAAAILAAIAVKSARVRSFGFEAQTGLFAVASILQ